MRRSASAARQAPAEGGKRPRPSRGVALDPVRDRAHHVGRGAHRPADGKRQRYSTRIRRHRTVPRFVVSHLRDDRAALGVVRRQPLDVRRQVVLDLALRLDDKAQVRAIASHAGGEADGERAGVPQRIEQRRTRIEFGQACLRPREMIFLLARRQGVARAHVGIARDERLRRVQRLRADLAGMVDTHQPRRVARLVRGQTGFRNPLARRGPRRRDGAGQRAQRAVEGNDEVFEHRAILRLQKQRAPGGALCRRAVA